MATMKQAICFMVEVYNGNTWVCAGLYSTKRLANARVTTLLADHEDDDAYDYDVEVSELFLDRDRDPDNGYEETAHGND